MAVLVFFVFSIAFSLLMGVREVAAYDVSVYSCDSSGGLKDFFGPSESVYACGDHYWSSEDVTIRVVPNGYPCSSSNSVSNVPAQADSAGHLGPVNLGTFPAGEYDIWVDRDNDGVCNLFLPRPEPVTRFGCLTGFLVVPEYWLGTVLGLVGCFAALGLFRVSKRNRK